MDTGSINSPSRLEPSSRLGNRNGKYYPDQFFDISQQYMPPTVKELFKWCTFYFYNSPLIGSAIRKISRYPITDLIFEDKNDKVKKLWDTVFNKHLKIKTRLLEMNLDNFTYGNCFVSIHMPFTRNLVCPNCGDSKPIKQRKWEWRQSSGGFHAVCDRCGYTGEMKAKDRTIKTFKGINLVRWNAQNMTIKYNDYTGRRLYLYDVPRKLRVRIMNGDKDILEDIPMIVLEAIRQNKMIRFNEGAIFHMKMPTLAEQDQGWGKPLLLHVLKELFYLYTLRRAQEAIALQHIIPFDIIYPLPNANINPYQHTSLGSWKGQIELALKKHRDDPNYKAVFPVPVGLQRIGGDGKLLMLTPEINILNQNIVGGMGIPQEFLFGGLNWTGSSVSLRTLENDFIQNRTDLLDFVVWTKDKLRTWLDLPDCDEVRFSDFRMADDIQKNQQLIGLNAQMKVSDQTMLTELGYDWEQEQSRMIEEAYYQNYLNDLRAKGNAKTQGEASIINFNYQNKINDLAQKAQEVAKKRALEFSFGKPNTLPSGMAPAGSTSSLHVENPALGADSVMGPDGTLDPGSIDSPADAAMESGAQATNTARIQNQEQDASPEEAALMPGQEADPVEAKVTRMASKLLKLSPNDAKQTLNDINSKYPELGVALNRKYNELRAQDATSETGQPVNMNPLPEQKVPRRQGAV